MYADASRFESRLHTAPTKTPSSLRLLKDWTSRTAGATVALVPRLATMAQPARAAMAAAVGMPFIGRPSIGIRVGYTHPEQRDGEGNVTKRAWSETVYDKRIEYHMTEGGNYGPQGPSGHGPTRHVYAGSDGRAGVISINIDGRSYERRYELSVASFEVVAVGTTATPSAASDGIFEFGECCEVRKVKLFNKAGSGRAPSPACVSLPNGGKVGRVRVRLEPNSWVKKVSGDVFCEESIQAGTQSKDIQGGMRSKSPVRAARSNTARRMPLSLGILYSISRATDDPRNGFRSANTTTEFAHLDLGLNKAFSFDAVVHQVETYTIPSQLGVEDASGDGSATRFQREYFNGHRKSSITAQFPVREDSGGLIGLESLSNNEATRLHMDIRNICVQNLGRDAQRRVKVVLWGNQPFAGDVDPVIAANYIMPHQLLFFTTDDNGATETHKLTYPGYTHEFPVLKPNRALTTFEGKFILENAPPYAGGEQRAAIFISDLHEPTGWRLVQQRAHKLRCEPQFKPDDIEGAIPCCSSARRRSHAPSTTRGISPRCRSVCVSRSTLSPGTAISTRVRSFHSGHIPSSAAT